MMWDAGPLTSADISHLEYAIKGTYKARSKSFFSGVRWKKSARPEGWQFGYRRRDRAIFQSGPLADWNKPVVVFGKVIKKNDIYAALEREEQILLGSWQNDNNDDYRFSDRVYRNPYVKRIHKSNAKLLNFFQPWRFINGKYFTDWNDGKTGLLGVLIFYGGILTLLTAIVFHLFG